MLFLLVLGAIAVAYLGIGLVLAVAFVIAELLENSRKPADSHPAASMTSQELLGYGISCMLAWGFAVWFAWCMLPREEPPSSS